MYLLSMTNATKTVQMDNAGLAQFAADAQAWARQLIAAGRSFGPRKVFISDLAAAMGAAVETAKEFLLAAHRAGLLTLSRADLVEAMDPAVVAASETEFVSQFGRIEFHFVTV